MYVYELSFVTFHCVCVSLFVYYIMYVCELSFVILL